MRIYINDKMRAELNELEAKEKLFPKEIVKFANRRKSSAIRAWLEEHGAYDENVAMTRWAGELSRRLIVRVKLASVDGAGKVHRTRAFVSLLGDRRNGRGYRAMAKVMTNDELLSELEETFAQELSSMQKRYDSLLRLERYRALFEAMLEVSDTEEERKAGGARLG